jgi:hypothetical protein
MLREFGELLERYTEERPLLLVTEDLQWSDAATLQLMDHTARRRQPARLLWLASFRLTEVIAADHPLKSLRHELRLHGLSDEIVLDAFSETDVADYVAARLPALAAEETFVRALYARTEGLPLFVADSVSELMTMSRRTAARACSRGWKPCRYRRIWPASSNVTSSGSRRRSVRSSRPRASAAWSFA